MQLLLARHGNTFTSGQPAVWVGSRNDLPLVESGKDQAIRLGQALKKAEFKPSVVFTGPLQRMTQYAEVFLKELNLKITPIIDHRLNEIDYGQWSGLTTEEVLNKFGTEDFEAWEKQGIWPEKGEWGESKNQVAERIKNFATFLTQTYSTEDNILVVASNGCLRFFLELIPGGLKDYIKNSSAKIATGNVSKLTHNNIWQLDFWNLNPSKIFEVI